jgi:hypothetical protein
VEILANRTKIRDIRDLQDGNELDQVLLVRDREVRQTRTGSDFMRLSLADRTASSPASSGMTSRTPR